MQQHLQAHLQSQNAVAGQQHPQVITLQQLQNFLPAQTITTDGNSVQVLNAANETTPTKQIKQERFVLTPQMQPHQQHQVLQLQSIPQQFIQVKGNSFIYVLYGKNVVLNLSFFLLGRVVKFCKMPGTQCFKWFNQCKRLL